MVFIYLSGAQDLQGASLVQTGGAFYHHHLFLPDGEEEHQVLPIEPGAQPNHPAERGGGQQGEGWGAQEHHCGYGIDAAANTREKENTEKEIKRYYWTRRLPGVYKYVNQKLLTPNTRNSNVRNRNQVINM